jgi:predicted RNA-binding protein with PIN domain
MAETTLYLFDGFNLLHASERTDPDDLVDMLASFVAGRGVRGVVVFDGTGVERDVGSLEVRWAAHADDLLERLAAAHRDAEQVCIVSSDDAVRRVSGQAVRKLSSRRFLAELDPEQHRDTELERRGAGGRVRDRLDDETLERLERLRRGDSS